VYATGPGSEEEEEEKEEHKEIEHKFRFLGRKWPSAPISSENR
jgi:hypothetical protein